MWTNRLALGASEARQRIAKDLESAVLLTLLPYRSEEHDLPAATEAKSSSSARHRGGQRARQDKAFALIAESGQQEQPAAAIGTTVLAQPSPFTSAVDEARIAAALFALHPVIALFIDHSAA